MGRSHTARLGKFPFMQAMFLRFHAKRIEPSKASESLADTSRLRRLRSLATRSALKLIEMMGYFLLAKVTFVLTTPSRSLRRTFSQAGSLANFHTKKSSNVPTPASWPWGLAVKFVTWLAQKHIQKYFLTFHCGKTARRRGAGARIKTASILRSAWAVR